MWAVGAAGYPLTYGSWVSSLGACVWWMQPGPTSTSQCPLLHPSFLSLPPSFPFSPLPLPPIPSLPLSLVRRFTPLQCPRGTRYISTTLLALPLKAHGRAPCVLSVSVITATHPCGPTCATAASSRSSEQVSERRPTFQGTLLHSSHVLSCSLCPLPVVVMNHCTHFEALHLS